MLHGFIRVMDSLPHQTETCSDLFCQPYNYLVYCETCDRGHVIYPLHILTCLHICPRPFRQLVPAQIPHPCACIEDHESNRSRMVGCVVFLSQILHSWYIHSATALVIRHIVFPMANIHMRLRRFQNISDPMTNQPLIRSLQERLWSAWCQYCGNDIVATGTVTGRR